MSEFKIFILEKVIPYITSSPPTFVALLGVLLFYFGYWTNQPKIKFPTEKSAIYVSGLAFVFGHLVIPLFFVSYLFQRGIDFQIESSPILDVIKAIAFIYSILVIRYTRLKSWLYRNTYTIHETDYVLRFLNLEHKDYSRYTAISLGEELFSKLSKLSLIQIIWLLFYLVFFEWMTVYVMILLLTIIFLSNASIPVGMIIFGYMFFAFSAFANYKGMNVRIYRYAGIALKDSETPETGRVIGISSDLIEILKIEEKQYRIKAIPISNIRDIELKASYETIEHNKDGKSESEAEETKSSLNDLTLNKNKSEGDGTEPEV